MAWLRGGILGLTEGLHECIVPWILPCLLTEFQIPIIEKNNSLFVEWVGRGNVYSLYNMDSWDPHFQQQLINVPDIGGMLDDQRGFYRISSPQPAFPGKPNLQEGHPGEKVSNWGTFFQGKRCPKYPFQLGT